MKIECFNLLNMFKSYCSFVSYILKEKKRLCTFYLHLKENISILKLYYKCMKLNIYMKKNVMWHSQNIFIPCITEEENFVVRTTFEVKNLFSMICS